MRGMLRESGHEDGSWRLMVSAREETSAAINSFILESCLLLSVGRPGVFVSKRELVVGRVFFLAPSRRPRIKTPRATVAFFFVSTLTGLHFKGKEHLSLGVSQNSSSSSSTYERGIAIDLAKSADGHPQCDTEGKVRVYGESRT